MNSQRDERGRLAVKHGQALPGKKSRAYFAWQSMIQRCTNPKNKRYADYGGRGISVCEAWRYDFSAFFASMGPPPPGLSLDRENNAKGYEPGNCRWATRSEQTRNQRRSAYVEIGGEARRVLDVEVSLGLSQGAIWHRLKKGWSVEQATTIPKGGRP